MLSLISCAPAPLITSTTSSDIYQFFLERPFLRAQVDLLMSKGRANLGELDEILEKFQTSPSFLENYDAIFFYNGYGCIYARRYEGQIV